MAKKIKMPPFVVSIVGKPDKYLTPEEVRKTVDDYIEHKNKESADREQRKGA